MEKIASSTVFNNRPVIIASLVFSGICWYLANGLSGNFWYLMWIAPVPVLCIALTHKSKTAFVCSFIPYLIGRLSWFSYLITVITLVPAIVFTILFALIYAIIIWLTRKIVRSGDPWYAVLAYPVLMTSFEYLVSILSHDGTASSIAYSQLNFLPAIQIASITGFTGITFLLCFAPSLVSLWWVYRIQKIRFRVPALVCTLLIVASLLFGLIRSSGRDKAAGIEAGALVLEEKYHDISRAPDFQRALSIAADYAKQIAGLAAKGARLVVLPERALNLNAENQAAVTAILSNEAKQDHILIVAGYTNFKDPKTRNSALVIDENGNALADYDKVHLVTGFEDWFTAGTGIAVFGFEGIHAGVAICKDLDFAAYIRRYGKDQAAFLTVPAWDFVADDWLHSRMAILRGVENGFSEIRSAREGRITITDYFGRVIAEARTAQHQQASVIGEVPPQGVRTLYSLLGDWFSMLNLLVMGCFIFLILLKRK